MKTRINLLLTMLLALTVPQQVQAADWMVRSDKFSMTSSNDHVNFKVRYSATSISRTPMPSRVASMP